MPRSSVESFRPAKGNLFRRKIDRIRMRFVHVKQDYAYRGRSQYHIWHMPFDFRQVQLFLGCEKRLFCVGGRALTCVHVRRKENTPIGKSIRVCLTEK